MHGQGNYTTQAGQAPYAPQPAFQHHPVAVPRPPPVPHHGPLPPPPHAIPQGHPYFHFRPGIVAYPNTVPSVPQQGPPVPAVTSGMSSNQSYVTYPQPPQGNAGAQMSCPYPASEQQRQPWNQNAHQFPPAAPLPAPSAYPLASSQEHTMERGRSFQPSFHGPPPPQPPSIPGFLRPDPYGPPVPPVRQHSFPQSMGTLPLPPPPPPPPLPSSSPPIVPPLPPSSPPSDILSNNEGSQGRIQDGNDSISEHTSPGKSVKDGSLHQAEDVLPHTEKIDPKVEFEDAIATHSPGDSDMDMEDDITLPDVERNDSLLNNSNDERISTSQDHHGKEHLQDVLDVGTQLLPEVALDGSALPEGSQDPNGGKERNEQAEQRLDDLSFQHENFNTPSVPIVTEAIGNSNLSGPVNEGTDPFSLLQDYASDDSSENEGANVPGDGSSQSNKDGHTNLDTGKVCKFGSELHRQSVSEASKNILVNSVNESPSMMEADSISIGTREVKEISGRSSRRQEFECDQHKDSSRHYDTDIGCEDAKMCPSDIKSDVTKLNVDEFGRLIREGVSDSDTSDSPRYARKQGRRARKRSRSQSRSPSPRGRRRRRSPWRKERRGRSRSWSPMRSRSRSPIVQRGIESTGDKPRQERGQPPVCFAFLRGKCYRGTTCRYSHHDPEKSEKKRYSRGKQYRDKPHELRNPDYREESNAIPEREKHMGTRLPLETFDLKEVNDSDDLPVDSSTHTLEKDEKDSSLLASDVLGSNLSRNSAHNVTSRKEDSLTPEPEGPDKIHQIINQPDQRSTDALFSNTPVMEAPLTAPASVPADQLDVKEAPPAVSSLGNPVSKPYFSQEVPSRPLEELLPSGATHLSQSGLPLPSVSQVVTLPFTQSAMQDYNKMPSVSQYHSAPANYSPYQAPVSYQNMPFPGLSNSLSSSFVLPPPPSQSRISTNLNAQEYTLPSQHMQHLLLPSHEGLSSNAYKESLPIEYPNRSLTGQFQLYSTMGEPGQRPHISNIFESALSSRLGASHVRGEECLTGYEVQERNHSRSFSEAQSHFSLPIQSLLRGMQGSGVGNPLSDGSRPYIQQVSHGPQYSVGTTITAQLTETGNTSSSLSNVTPGFPQNTLPSYVHEIVGSRTSNNFSPYAPTFSQPLGFKLGSNALTQENDLNKHVGYGASFVLASASGDGHKIGSTNMVSSNCGLPAVNVIPRLGGNQYDPLFDSIDPASNSFTRVDQLNREIVGDSDDVLKLGGSGRMLNTEAINQEKGLAVSLSDSVENEEFGETADAGVGAVLSGSPCYPNEAPDMNAGEIEMDQVKKSGKKKKSHEKSMKLFKISIAAFVKEVLKPSWRQGNMSKEAFKTIVKKTVDKVSGAMKSHRIPRSQTRINHYIDSSRGKLTKLVMGYVDKYVKV
ncbi:uncharacterized protein LOC127240866 [Andrographis paniculata]|uniref:uncharacterized protein LOC127240866 n=1 Tax=Andrographis paniculata TaxID=175694 RepID=UPI0021E6E804|nr:uncharacterized protein LOC127240866 [Andrographis paniculata]